MIELRPGDLILVRGRGWIARAIKRCTRSRGEAPTRVTHVAIAVDRDSIVEAHLRSGVRHARFTSGNVFRLNTETVPGDGERIALYCRAAVGLKYGWGKIVLHALGLGRFAGVERWPVCSTLAAHAYASAGYYLGVPPLSATPDDIDDYVRSHPERFHEVTE